MLRFQWRSQEISHERWTQVMSIYIFLLEDKRGASFVFCKRLILMLILILDLIFLFWILFSFSFSSSFLFSLAFYLFDLLNIIESIWRITDEHDDRNLRANQWTPENGFGDDELKEDKHSYPLPAVGNVISKRSLLHVLGIFSWMLKNDSFHGLNRTRQRIGPHVDHENSTWWLLLLEH